MAEGFLGQSCSWGRKVELVILLILYARVSFPLKSWFTSELTFFEILNAWEGEREWSCDPVHPLCFSFWAGAVTWRHGSQAHKGKGGTQKLQGFTKQEPHQSSFPPHHRVVRAWIQELMMAESDVTRHSGDLPSNSCAVSHLTSVSSNLYMCKTRLTGLECWWMSVVLVQEEDWVWVWGQPGLYCWVLITTKSK